jgi:outer membrane receptor protein involved in Fe transport
LPEATARTIPAQDEIVVTGSRIRGAPPSAPVTLVRQVTMREHLNDLGDAVRAIPQNFNGGQNPGVTFGVPGSQNVTSGSGLNLRGLGADALTLLNGHRLAYDSATQAIDISAIPVAAVERLEVIADGASALYGSDAVAGVANVILKRDFAGLDTRARIGSTTEGGGFQQEYSLVGGQRWRSGGFMVVADFTKSSAIRARDRAFTSALPGDSVLYPEQKALNFVLTGHQAVGTADASIDAFYNHRTSFTTSSYALPDYLADGTTHSTPISSPTRSRRVFRFRSAAGTPRSKAFAAKTMSGPIRSITTMENRSALIRSLTPMR